MKAALHSLLNRVPRFKAKLKKLRSYLMPSDGISSNYVSLKVDELEIESARLRNSWRNSALPERQRELVDQQLHQYRSGTRIDVFDVLVDALRALPNFEKGVSLLEVGCSSGFYSEVLEIAEMPISYSGCDYSDAFISLAKRRYPLISFAVEDATNLSYPDDSFDIVVSGCCLLHIPEYAKGIEETARVTSRYAIFHRTPVVWGQSEQWYRKQAYGVETVEIHFNESEFLTLLEKNGLEQIATYTLSEISADASHTQGYANRTYVCRKKKQ
jgi:2-polyprenyl-3-methyl-5-hydroxy-6-metoxy-1,4-benzoquinol methylase